jgi:hypothetical protein
MSISLTESGAINASGKGKKWSIKVIESGWGSSGYYSASMLEEYGPKVFAKGTKVFMNHPGVSEESERPERDVNQLAGKLVSDAKFDGTGLVAEVEFYSHFAPIIREMAGDVGLSIRALGESRIGEAEGREGPIIEALVADPLTSVDVVTVAGAGGKFLSLLESYTRKDDEASLLSESVSEGNEMLTKEEFETAIAELKEAFVDAISPLRESVSVLVEAATPAETEEATDEAAEEVAVEPAVDPVEVAEKFNESRLPTIALKRIAEAMKSESNTKTVDELIAEEKNYVSLVSESAVTANVVDTTGVIYEATTTNLVDEWAAITSRITKK